MRAGTACCQRFQRLKDQRYPDSHYELFKTQFLKPKSDSCFLPLVGDMSRVESSGRRADAAAPMILVKSDVFYSKRPHVVALIALA